MKKPINPLVEFGLVILLIVAAVVFALNIHVVWPSSTKNPDTLTAPAATKDKPPVDAKWQKGKELFKSNCAACHNPKADGTGPALAGVEKRWQAAGDYKGKTGVQWMHEWVRDWNVPVSAGYKYAVDMSNSRIAAMNTFPTLKDDDIDAIVSYVDNPQNNVP